jgi:hypothetical protein
VPHIPLLTGRKTAHRPEKLCEIRTATSAESSQQPNVTGLFVNAVNKLMIFAENCDISPKTPL